MTVMPLPASQQRWLELTRTVLPARARAERWVLREDHCFQRVVLDAVCGGRWYDHVEGRPAYTHLGDTRLADAVALAERLAADADAGELLRTLDRQSLAYRGKSRVRRAGASEPARDYTDGS